MPGDKKPLQADQQFRVQMLDPDAFATTLLVLVMDRYGNEALEWSPETLALELADDLGRPLPRSNFDRLMAAIVILTTDNYFLSLPDFIDLTNILSGDTYDPSMWDPAEVDEIAWGLSEALLINPPDEDNEEPFADDIRRYIGQALDREGIMQPPDILKVALRGDPQVAGRVQHDFVDDPIMFGAIADFEKAKTDEIDAIVRTGLKRLLLQLSRLQLQHGSTADLLSALAH